MERRQEIREEVGEVMGRSITTGTPHNDQMRSLQALSIESTLMLDETIDKMNATNKELDASNKNLAKSNLRLQRVAIGVAVLAIIISVTLGVIALKSKQTVKIEVNGKETTQKSN